jgi:hypothetical protein
LLVATRGTVTVALRRWVRPSLGAVLGFAVVVGMAIVALSILALPGENRSGLAPPVAPDAGSPDQPAPASGPGSGTSGEPVAEEQPLASADAVEAAGDAGVSPLPQAPAPGEEPAAGEASSTPVPDASSTPATAAPGPTASATTTSAPRPATTTTRPPASGDGGVLTDLLGALGLAP